MRRRHYRVRVVYTAGTGPVSSIGFKFEVVTAESIFVILFSGQRYHLRVGMHLAQIRPELNACAAALGLSRSVRSFWESMEHGGCSIPLTSVEPKLTQTIIW